MQTEQAVTIGPAGGGCETGGDQFGGKSFDGEFVGIFRMNTGAGGECQAIFAELDVLVYATGFDAHAYMRPINTYGLNGITIEANHALVTDNI